MNSIILIESIVYNTNDKNDGLEIDLIDFTNLSELNEENIGIEDNTLNYTTPLKYKGLESKFIFLICNEINAHNYYELYVGITRAIFQVQILIIDD
jgi:superfamily I DNA/RNA helicase